jgi:hypothetical protein
MAIDAGVVVVAVVEVVAFEQPFSPLVLVGHPMQYPLLFRGRSLLKATHRFANAHSFLSFAFVCGFFKCPSSHSVSTLSQ